MDYVNVKQAAELMGKSARMVQIMCKSGEIEAVVQPHPQMNKPCYYIPISALPEQAQARYRQGLREDVGAAPEKIFECIKTPQKQKKNRVKKPLEAFTQEERDRIAEWCDIIKEWRDVRTEYKCKKDIDKAFVGKATIEHPGFEISVQILYRKYNAYVEQDFERILDGRGGWNRGESSVDDMLFDTFLCYWLHDNKMTKQRCYELTQEWCMTFLPEIVDEMPSISSFSRRINRDVAGYVIERARLGEKASRDRWAPYVMRAYGELHANTVWFADTHTLDVQSVSDAGKNHRLYLTAFLDAKTGVMVGWNISDEVTSQSVLLAFRHAILRFGIPEYVYADNGHEYTARDVGGKGFRRMKEMDVFPPNVMERLGCKIVNAIVRNARAKSIERAFLTIKNQYSRLWTGFNGGCIAEKKESLKSIVKCGMLPMDKQIYDSFGGYIDGEYNCSDYGGTEKQYCGMSRIEVWNESISHVDNRRTTADELTLLLARSTNYQKVKRNGVWIEIHGERIWYCNPEETYKHIGERVYVRYDPCDLRSVRIYNEKDQYMDVWNLADALVLELVGEDPERVAEAQRIIRDTQKSIRKQTFAHLERIPANMRISALDLSIQRAQRQKNAKFAIRVPTNIVPVRAGEEPVETAKKAVGENVQCVDIDYKRMIAKHEK